MFGWRKRIGYIAPTVIEVVPTNSTTSRRTASASPASPATSTTGGPSEFEKALAQVDDGGDLSRLARRRFHHPRRRPAGGGARQGLRGDHRQGHRGRRQGARRPPASAPRMEALRHIGARRIAIASPYPERHNDALTGYLARNGFEIVRAEGMDLPFKEMQNLPPADIQQFADGVLAARRRLRRALSALPAMAGGADRRAAGARQRQAGGGLHACLLLRRVQGDRHDRCRSAATAGCSPRWRRRDMKSRSVSLARAALAFIVAAALAARASAARAQSVADFYRGKTIEIRRSAARRPAATTSPARTIANHMGRAHPGQSHHRRAQHAGRDRPDHDQLPLQRRQARRHRDRHADQQHAARAAAQADLARRRNVKFDHRAVRLDRHAAAGAAGHLGLAHRAGARASTTSRRNTILMGATTVVGRQLRPADCWSTRCSARACRSSPAIRARTRSTSPPSAARCRATIPACPTSPSTRPTGCATARSASCCNTAPSGCRAQGRADRDRAGALRGRPRAAALLRR